MPEGYWRGRRALYWLHCSAAKCVVDGAMAVVTTAPLTLQLVSLHCAYRVLDPNLTTKLRLTFQYSPSPGGRHSRKWRKRRRGKSRWVRKMCLHVAAIGSGVRFAGWFFGRPSPLYCGLFPNVYVDPNCYSISVSLYDDSLSLCYIFWL